MGLEELSGWIGAILVLFAYFIVATNKVKPDSNIFQWSNILGAGFLIYYTYSCGAFASMAVNIIWVFIGLNSLINTIKLNKVKNQAPQATI